MLSSLVTGLFRSIGFQVSISRCVFGMEGDRVKLVRPWVSYGWILYYLGHKVRTRASYMRRSDWEVFFSSLYRFSSLAGRNRIMEIVHSAGPRGVRAWFFVLTVGYMLVRLVRKLVPIFLSCMIYYSLFCFYFENGYERVFFVR